MTAAAGLVLAAGLVGMAAMGSGRAQQANGSQGGSFFDGFIQTIHERHMRFALWVQSVFSGGPAQSSPKLYVDGVRSRSAPEVFGEGQGVHYYLPDQNIYVLTLHPPAGSPLQPAGSVNGAVVQFQWNGKAYRIKAPGPLVSDAELPVYVLEYGDFHALHH